ncbi:MAG: tyrosine-protein phosphatase [Ramlibacter sp.]|nr:tyrosine-protein phosphatase [Ramlibacter sp.]
MTLRPVVLPPNVCGTLRLSSMPGRFGPWQAFETEARRVGLAEGKLSFRWHDLPMPNFGLPEDPSAFRRNISRIAAALRDGDAVMLHCAAGLGRTGTAAACVLKALGVDQAEALERVREAGSNPQNAKQSGLVGWL